MTRATLLAAASLALLPSLLRAAAGARAPAPGACAPEGRGAPPRQWVGCAGDPGPPRALDGTERLALGLPVDLNRATAADLAVVPGLDGRLAAEVVAHRAARGAFRSVEGLVAVRGVGPARLARARPHLVASAPPLE
jgi:competence protein ComEA